MNRSEDRIPTPPFTHVGIFGGGLIGGSLALSLRDRGVADQVTVLDPSKAVRAIWSERGVTNVARLPLPEPAPELLVLAGPPSANLEWLPEVARLWPRALVTDVGSVKRSILETASKLAQRAPNLRFVGSHPLAGSERSGPDAALPDLFSGRVVVLCPLPNAELPVLHSVSRTWRLLGAVPVELAADEHDAVVATTSHLPQIVASALAAYVGGLATAGSPAELLIGPGLLDTTRLAGSSPELWGEILTANAENWRPRLRELGAQMIQLAGAEPAAWQSCLAAGRLARRRWEGE